MNYLREVNILILLLTFFTVSAQDIDSSLLTIDRIYSSEFRQEYQRPINWIEDGAAFVTIEKENGGDALIRYESESLERTVFLPASSISLEGKAMTIEDFSLSKDGSKIILFTNSSRVWRTNTKGDYYVYNFNTKKLKQLGRDLPSSSLMFAKFNHDESLVAYVHDFNIYLEDYDDDFAIRLTQDGNRDLINGTFDWVYEEEFGKRDGFSWSPESGYIAFWQVDASEIGTFYMINNIDSIYSQPVPLQYPKVGQDPSVVRLGLVDMKNERIRFIPLEEMEADSYIPAIQWIEDDLLLIQQMNRLQNKLTIWAYEPSTDNMRKVYTETEETWVDINYPDISSASWGKNDLLIVDDNQSFLRMTENDKWRRVVKVNIATGLKTTVTQGEYDVASIAGTDDNYLYYIASPDNSTQRYLYRTSLDGSGKEMRLTPKSFSGVNTYNLSPNGKYAIHYNNSSQRVKTVHLIRVDEHEIISTLIDNNKYKEALSKLDMPEVRFMQIPIDDGYVTDARIVLPLDFDESKKYPVLFHVYGEPWGQVATDTEVSLWDKMLAQKGYVVIDIDNRGTPCLKGSAWRKSIYKKIGVLNTHDQATAAKEILKLPYLDETRTAVWGWSGGGSMTLNLMFRHPDVYTTGMAIAAVSNQLIYDNIYQERYMGLPQNDPTAFEDGSPISQAKNLEGNLLIIHGTADDNVHYQSAELLINELIAQNKQFDFMAYPNRSHGIYEGKNTRRHLYNLLTNYLMEHVPVNP